jgi:hypothetical protein
LISNSFVVEDVVTEWTWRLDEVEQAEVEDFI